MGFEIKNNTPEKDFADLAEYVFSTFPDFKTIGTKEQYIHYLKIRSREKKADLVLGSVIDKHNFEMHVKKLLS